MKRTFNKLLGILAIASIAILLPGCCNKDSEDKITKSGEKVFMYFSKDMKLPTAKDKFAAYFDFSDGMQFAYSNDTTKAVLKSMVQKITGNSDKFDMFSMQDGSIEPLSSRTTELYNTIIDPKSYNHQNAPIEKTLKKIVEDGKSALLVTDFEEYSEGRIQQQAFATQYFEEWLKSGKDITFFITDYKEKKNNKHLYYIVFDDPSHKLLKTIEEGMKGTDENYKRFLLSTNAYSFTTDYPLANGGGTYHDQNNQDNVTVAIEDGSEESVYINKDFKMEYYPLGGGSWTDIINNAKELQENGVDPKDRFDHLLSNLYADFSNQDSYIIDEVDIKVSDVQADFEAFDNYRIAQQAEKPTKGEENDYYDAVGNLKQEFVYEPKPIKEIEEMFKFDEDLFENSMEKDPKNVMFAIDFDPKFTGANANSNLLRIDIFIKERTPNIDNLAPLFSWSGNDNLMMAIKNTLQDLKTVENPVYTYFIKLV